MLNPKPRIGVYICHCGVNISATVDVEAVAAFAAGLPGVIVARDYMYMCSDPGQALIRQDIEEHDLNRVVVASCSPRMHEPTFRGAAEKAGLNPYLVDMANIREQCAWVHVKGAETTGKAKTLVASAVARAALLEPLEAREVEVTPGTLVIGGGLAGMVAALDIADAGFPVTLVEQSDHLGGRVAELDSTYPSLESAAELLDPLIERVQSHPYIAVLLGSRVAKIEGYVGNFEVSVGKLGNWETGEGDRSTDLPIYQVGSIVVATGYDAFDPRRKPEYGYGQYPNVITTLEMERLLQAKSPVSNLQSLLPNPQSAIRSVAFIKCVGSRDAQVGNPYCSRVCCMVAAKQAHLVKDLLPETAVAVFYMDVRTSGKGGEEFYDEVRKKGVIYRRGNVSEIVRRGDRVALIAEDTLLGQPIEIEADLVVLAVGMEPRANADSIATLLKLPRSPDGFFLELHPKLRPVDTAVDGVFLAGCCQGPKDIPDTVAQAKAAASSALIPLLRGTVLAESATAVVEEELCAGCGMCVEVCPYGAPALHPLWGVSRINAVLCKGCGACASACPSKAIRLQHFTEEQVLAQIDALVGV
ncbi:MAG: CoB--CoM heterodisulfide reductase iron-sulfur subunit A family protein [Anaerolineae bacterium]|nr:CoB--CoM heterodisulfide reductase iron-sulfur subunit A family protein [Anaerolineae bacterium]